MKTALCELLGIEYPIVAAPMGPDLTGPDLVAAVSNAGGLGILQAQLASPQLFREEIRRVRELTDKPFGVNLILHFPVDEQVAICIDERVPIVSFFWGDPTPYVEHVRSGGAKVFHQIGSVADAQRAAKANVDVIIAQGVEAGGHVAGEVSTLALVPRVIDAVAPLPVAAAGGIADGRGVAAALALGAQAAIIGTRFLASTEARAHPEYKKKLLSANEDDTIRTTLFGFGWPNAPHRTLRTRFVEDWLETKHAAKNRARTNRSSAIPLSPAKKCRFSASWGSRQTSIQPVTSDRWIYWRAKASVSSARSSLRQKLFVR